MYRLINPNAVNATQASGQTQSDFIEEISLIGSNFIETNDDELTNLLNAAVAGGPNANDVLTTINQWSKDCVIGGHAIHFTLDKNNELCLTIDEKYLGDYSKHLMAVKAMEMIFERTGIKINRVIQVMHINDPYVGKMIAGIFTTTINKDESMTVSFEDEYSNDPIFTTTDMNELTKYFWKKNPGYIRAKKVRESRRER